MGPADSLEASLEWKSGSPAPYARGNNGGKGRDFNPKGSRTSSRRPQFAALSDGAKGARSEAKRAPRRRVSSCDPARLRARLERPLRDTSCCRMKISRRAAARLPAPPCPAHELQNRPSAGTYRLSPMYESDSLTFSAPSSARRTAARTVE
jgi:hypothetical protein